MYFRLVSLLATLLACWLIALLAWRVLKKEGPVSPMPFVLILYAVFAYLFTMQTYNYSLEMRPYSLWNALWFVIGALFLYHPEKRVVIFLLLVAMGLTASGALFQFIAVGAAVLLMSLLLGSPWKKGLRDGLILTLPAFLLALKYCRLTDDLGNRPGEGQNWLSFLTYMFTNEHVPIMTVMAIGLCFLQRETRKFAYPAVLLLILFLMGPLVYTSTRSRGMFFADRQYIYYNTAIPFFFLIAARIYPALMKMLAQPMRRRALVAALWVLMGGGYLAYFHGRVEAAREHFLMDEPFGFFNDDKRELTALLKTEFPKGFCLDLAEHRADFRFGLQLLSESMPVRYGHDAFGSKTVFLSERDGVPYVAAISDGACDRNNFVEARREMAL